MASEDVLPELPKQSCLTEMSHLATASRPRHTLSAPAIPLYKTTYSRTPSNGSSPASTSPSSIKRISSSRKNIEWMRVARTEWSSKEKALTSLRSDNADLLQQVRLLQDKQHDCKQYEMGCVKLAQTLSCSTEGVSTDTLHDIICPQVVQLCRAYSQANNELATCRADVDTARAELAATEVKLSSALNELNSLKSSIAIKDSQTQQHKLEVEEARQNCARTSSMLATLRKQMSDASNQSNEDKTLLAQLQINNKELKQDIKQKANKMLAVEEQLHQALLLKTEFQERATVADTAFEELCLQLSDILCIDGCDIDQIIHSVTQLFNEQQQLKMRLETLMHSSQATELDAKANRDTILRLVSENKKYSEQTKNVEILEKRISDLQETVAVTDKERSSLSERLDVNRNTIKALQQELQAREMQCKSLTTTIETLQQEANSSVLQNTLQSQKNDTILRKLADMLQCGKDGDSILVAIKQVLEKRDRLEKDVSCKTAQLVDITAQLKQKDQQLSDTNESIEIKQAKMEEMASSIESMDLLQEQLHKQQNKHEEFMRHISNKLGLTAIADKVLLGQLTEDGILLRAEQLLKLESGAVADKQTTIYSLQRKLKSLKQQLDTKDVHLGLMQSKAASLEERLTDVLHKEAHWDANIERSKKMERQIDKFHTRVIKQSETIAQLKVEADNIERLKEYCAEQNQKVAEFSVEIEQLQSNKVHLSQQLAETRQKLQSSYSRDKERADLAEKELEKMKQENQTIKIRESKLLELEASMRKLLHCTDDDVVSALKQELENSARYQELSHNLQQSLHQLETGFRTNYQDALTLFDD